MENERNWYEMDDLGHEYDPKEFREDPILFARATLDDWLEYDKGHLDIKSEEMVRRTVHCIRLMEQKLGVSL